jgi:hypothetical protein
MCCELLPFNIWYVAQQILNTDLDQYPVLIKDASNMNFLQLYQELVPFKPIALVQNLTNDIQGPNGVNFTEQELNFRVRFRIENQVTQKNVYNRLVPIDQNCLLVGNSNDPAQRALCQGEPQVRVYLAQSVTKSGSTYTIVPETNFAGTGIKEFLLIDLCRCIFHHLSQMNLCHNI